MSEIHRPAQRGITELPGKTAVVTGAASGIGLALAHELVASGMNVVLADVEAPRLEAAVSSLSAPEGTVIGVRTDVSDLEDLERLAAQTMATFGAVHVLCNNAGVETGGWVDEVALSGWEWVLDVNLWGVINGCRTFLPLLRQQDSAHIVNTGSMSSFTAREPLTFGPYAVSKFGVLAFSEALDAELLARGDNIGISVLTPGPVRTDMARAERNRPSGVPSSTGSGLRAQIIGAIADITESEGMPAADVARMVKRAILDDRFFILTHPEGAFAAVEDRLRRMRDGVTPTSTESPE